MPTEIKLEKLGLPRGYKPLAANRNLLYLYHAGSIVPYDQEKNAWGTPIQLERPTWKDRCRLLVRLFRREPRTALYQNGQLLLVWKKSVYTIDVQTGKITLVQRPREGFSDPLQLCPAVGTLYQAHWGDYGPNPDRACVQIYGLTPGGTAEVVYTFPAHSVRHVHGIVPHGTDGYYIFTGDNEPDAGIYHADLSFSHVEPVARGSQQYRAVVGFATEQGLLYATDAVNEPNYIYLIKPDGTTQTITGLNGSCIYGGRYKDGYLFSTTVEPDERNRGPLSWISYQRGAGILSDEVHLVFVDRDMSPRIVGKFKKDLLPMKLFQYGSIQFARRETGEVILYPVAVKKMDARALALHDDENGDGCE